MNRRSSDLISAAPFTMLFLALNVGIYLYTSALSRNFMHTAGDVSLQLFDSRREGLWEGQWLRLIAPNFLHGGLLHIAMNMYMLYSVGPSAEAHFGSSNFGTLYLLSGVAGFCFSQIFGGHPALGASAALFGLYGAEMAIVILRAPVLKYAWRNSEVRSTAFTMSILILIGVSGLMGNVDNWAHLGGFIVGGLLGGFFDIWRTRRRLGPSLVLGVLVLVGALVAAARWSVFNPYYHVHQALIAKEENRDDDMSREFNEALIWARYWNHEHETKTFIAWIATGTWTRELALRTSYAFQAAHMREQQRERMQHATAERPSDQRVTILSPRLDAALQHLDRRESLLHIFPRQSGGGLVVRAMAVENNFAIFRQRGFHAPQCAQRDRAFEMVLPEFFVAVIGTHQQRPTDPFRNFVRDLLRIDFYEIVHRDILPFPVKMPAPHHDEKMCNAEAIRFVFADRCENFPEC